MRLGWGPGGSPWGPGASLNFWRSVAVGEGGPPHKYDLKGTTRPVLSRRFLMLALLHYERERERDIYIYACIQYIYIYILHT